LYKSKSTHQHLRKSCFQRVYTIGKKNHCKNIKQPENHNHQDTKVSSNIAPEKKKDRHKKKEDLK
jgi:hypothetical protein